MDGQAQRPGSGHETAERTKQRAISAALIDLSLRITRTDRDDKRDAQMQVYLDDLMRWPTEVAVKALRIWPEQEYGWRWPGWHELLKLLGEVAEEMQARLPAPSQSQSGQIPDHIMHQRTTVPYSYKFAWDELNLNIAKAQAMDGKEGLVRQLCMIHDFQEIHARARGWA